MVLSCELQSSQHKKDGISKPQSHCFWNIMAMVPFPHGQMYKIFQEGKIWSKKKEGGGEGEKKEDAVRNEKEKGKEEQKKHDSWTWTRKFLGTMTPLFLLVRHSLFYFSPSTIPTCNMICLLFLQEYKALWEQGHHVFQSLIYPLVHKRCSINVYWKCIFPNIPYEQCLSSFICRIYCSVKYRHIQARFEEKFKSREGYGLTL